MVSIRCSLDFLSDNFGFNEGYCITINKKDYMDVVIWSKMVEVLYPRIFNILVSVCVTFTL